MFLFSSQGFKRIGATLLLPIISSLQMSADPGAYALLQVLSPLAAFLGVAGIAQATRRGSLRTYIVATIGASIAVIQLIPDLHKYLPLLNGLFIFLAGGAIGEKVNEDVK